MSSQIQSVIENRFAEDAERSFSVAKLFSTLMKEFSKDNKVISISNFITESKVRNYVFKSIVRFAFLIEPVKKPKIDSTKFSSRWFTDSLERQDPRLASFDECLAIFHKLLRDLDRDLSGSGGERNLELLQLFQTYNKVPYELPLDYVQSQIDKIHTEDNVRWMWDNLPRKTVLLRSYLLNPNQTNLSKEFNLVYTKKVKTKTYLTDRALTGDYKTNREKRWEAHPKSVQYALRRECLAIEHVLVSQMCNFQGFPPQLKRILDENEIILRVENPPFRCPVTMRPMVFEEFIQEVTHSTHGKSTFQVGHMNPLKAINDDKVSGHTHKNISWISADGNRIQGDLSLDETRKMIVAISREYERLNIQV